MVNAVAGASRPAAANPRDVKLREAAQEFEALFVEMVFKQMRSANNALSGEQKSFARSTYESWQDEETAKSISRQGSFGLAEILYRQLQNQAAASGEL
ncbi:MAG TPA: rod-binding protein [Symbiobacteriaceae bacterium]|nr:rod-binding protein [Symbiobacteriaceae bacterium]